MKRRIPFEDEMQPRIIPASGIPDIPALAGNGLIQIATQTELNTATLNKILSVLRHQGIITK
jgi:hypothetical protein